LFTILSAPSPLYDRGANGAQAAAPTAWEKGPAVTTIGSTSTIPAGSQISPANERVYHQSNLVGDWKGTYTTTNQPIEFKVVNIKGSTAQVEYTHNGYTERGTATVSGNAITYGAIAIGTNDGQSAALQFKYGTVSSNAVMTKSAATADQNMMVGSWIGSDDTGSVSIQVQSISGHDAQVAYSIMGQAGQGTGDFYKNAVDIGNVQVSSTDGLNGTAIYKVGNQTLSMAVQKFTPTTA
jgi:hypothetical protein